MHANNKSNRKPPERPADKRRVPSPIIGVLALAAVAVLAVWWYKSSPADAPPAAAPPMETQATNPPVMAAASKPDFQRLKGQWQRPDGGYVIEITSVDDAGKIEAAYFNPRSIHVAKAQVTQDGAITKVFIELRDLNYPGSTYTLTYEPASDQLKGIYFQALQQQRFEVFFERLK